MIAAKPNRAERLELIICVRGKRSRMRDDQARRGAVWRYRWPLRGCAAVAGLVLVLAVGCAVYLNRAADNMPDVGPEADILAEGGWVQRDTVTPVLSVIADNWTFTYGPVIYVNYRGPVTKDRLEPLTRLTDLQKLNLINVHGSDPRVWPLLAKLSTLQEFTTVSTDIRDEDLVHLEGLPRLRRVNLWDNPNLTQARVDRLRLARPDMHINFP
jgi:hypothetical protein